MDLATDRAAYKMADEFDANILAYTSGYDYDPDTGLWTARTAPSGTKADLNADNDELLSNHKVDRASFGAGSAGDSLAVGVAGTYDVTPLQLLNRFNRMLDQNNVDKEGRWVVIDPVFAEILMDENSKLINSDYNPGVSQLTNGRLTANNIRGFRVYMSNNLPRLGTGPGTASTTGSSTNYGVVMAGHDSSVASAQQIDKTEKYRDPNSFSDVVRGLNLYGRKILRSEGLVRAIYNSN